MTEDEVRAELYDAIAEAWREQETSIVLTHEEAEELYTYTLRDPRYSDRVGDSDRVIQEILANNQ